MADLRKYLEDKKAAISDQAAADRAEREAAGERRKAWQHAANAQLKTALAIARQRADELQKSGVLGVGVTQSDGRLVGLSLSMSYGARSMVYAIDTLAEHVSILQSHDPAAGPRGRTNVTAHFNVTKLEDLNEDLINALVTAIIDEVYKP